MELGDAQRLYDRALQHRNDQHQYIAQAQREAASRAAILPNLQAEVAWAKGCLDSALGRAVDWQTLKEYVRQQHALTESQLAEVRDLTRYPPTPHN